MLHSTPLAAPLKLSSDPAPVHGYLSTGANARFLPWNWGRKTLVLFLPWACQFRQVLHPWQVPYHYLLHQSPP